MRDHWDYDPTNPHAMIPLTEEEISAFHRQGITPPAIAPGDPEFGRRAPGDTAKFVGPKVPAWVTDPEKWQSLSRAERRALERHHRKVSKK